jgi:hypothetical protein
MNHLKMLAEICALVESDFVVDMECKAHLPDQKPYTQKEAREMGILLADIYSIAHAIHCEACAKPYLL